jgi:hypothetical protein
MKLEYITSVDGRQTTRNPYLFFFSVLPFLVGTYL